ncbi:MAG: hypothetical protein CSB03_00285 [Bacteroidia bacterium]|nr:MAG: hypothetical protein CSB03_00285 [Bacteroidia bacterium]
MTKCIVQDKRTYYCFEEGLSEELEPLIDLVEHYLEEGDLPRHCVAPPPKGELKGGFQPSKEISLSKQNFPFRRPLHGQDSSVVEPVETHRSTTNKIDFGVSTSSTTKIKEWEITPIYEGRNRLLRARKGEYDLVIKCFAVPNILRGLYYGWGRNSKAKRSFQNSFYLEELEVGVAKPRAFVEEHSHFGLLKRSYYIADWIDYTANNIQAHMRGWSNPNGFIPALAQFIASLHELGIEHRDLSPGNILYKYDRLTKNYDFSLVDVNRMQSYPYALSPSLSLKNLERLASNYSVSSQLAHYYAEARRWNREKTIEELNRLCDDFWLNRLKKLSIRILKREKGFSFWQTFKLYLSYKWTKWRRKLTSDAGKKAELYLQEEELYRKYFSLEDIRHTLRRKEHYAYLIDEDKLSL